MDFLYLYKVCNRYYSSHGKPAQLKNFHIVPDVKPGTTYEGVVIEVN